MYMLEEIYVNTHNNLFFTIISLGIWTLEGENIFTVIIKTLTLFPYYPT